VRPLRHALDVFRLRTLEEQQRQLFVLAARLVVERSARKVIDQIQELAPLPRAPELPEIDAAEREISFDRPAIPR
jgi:hypothetical protein